MRMISLAPINEAQSHQLYCHCSYTTILEVDPVRKKNYNFENDQD